MFFKVHIPNLQCRLCGKICSHPDHKVIRNSRKSMFITTILFSYFWAISSIGHDNTVFVIVIQRSMNAKTLIIIGTTGQEKVLRN